MRMQELRRQMAARDLTAVLLLSPSNVYYYSGFTGSNGALLITAQKQYLLTDPRYLEQAASQAPAFKVMDMGLELFALLTKFVEPAALWGLEEKVMTVEQFQKWRAAFPQGEMEPFSEGPSRQRQVKDGRELALLREGLHQTDRAFEYILGEIHPGVEEREIALKLEIFLRQKGASGTSFDFIVASGWRSALPHGVATDKKVAFGELLTMDFGGVFQKYCTDFTRTICVGQAEAKQEEVYKVVLAAQMAGLAALRPGLTGKEVDAAAREVIVKAGYGEYFVHSLGHSLGLEIHEKPNLNSREEKTLEPGMLVTVEPGVYLPGWGGVRIEDVALITENGAEVLTQAPKQFIIIR